MSTKFEQVKTGQEKSYAVNKWTSWSGDCQSLELVPDITGDGVADYLSLEVTGGSYEDCRADRTYEKMALFLYPGILKDEVLTKGSPQELYSAAPQRFEIRIDPFEDTYVQPFSTPRPVIQPVVEDYNNDGINDISFWLFTGAVEGRYSLTENYRQILLINKGQS